MKTKTESISSFFEQDHRQIDALYESLRFEAPEEALPHLAEFDRRLERHIRWEEEILFSAVVRQAPFLAGGPIRIMRQEHEQIRRLKAEAAGALRGGDSALACSRAHEMFRVLKEHNAKEERVLYPACDNMLAPARVAEILRKVLEG